MSEAAPAASARLDRGAVAKLETVVALLATERGPTSVRDPEQAWRVHVDDSAIGLGFDELRSARLIGDLGAGAGFPGLVLAAALPEAEVDLIEATGRKCDFMRSAIEQSGIQNASVVESRAEAWGGGEGRERYEALTARAVARLATLAELSSPLLSEGGHLVAWKGRRDSDEEAELERAVARTAVEPVEIRAVTPYPGSENRHIHLLRKNGPTPNDLPRRDGVAKKRPFGSEPSRRSTPNPTPESR